MYGRSSYEQKLPSRCVHAPVNLTTTCSTNRTPLSVSGWMGIKIKASTAGLPGGIIDYQNENKIWFMVMKKKIEIVISEKW